MQSALRSVVVRTDVSGQLKGLLFKGEHFQEESLPLKVGSTGCPETSVWNYHTMRRNIPRERTSHLYLIGSLKSRTAVRFSHVALF
jgi:hypothetical protein